MNRVFAGAVVALVAFCGPSLAEGPMTPVRPGAGAGSSQWVEPPPSAETEPPAEGVRAASAGSGEIRAARRPHNQHRARSQARSSRRPGRAFSAASDRMAARLNRQELSRIRSGSGAYDYRFYAPWSGY